MSSCASQSAALPPKPTSDLADAWRALADVAKELHRIASALAGSPVPSGPETPLSFPAPSPSPASVALSTAVNELLLSKVRAGRGDEYVRQLRHALAQFSVGRGSRALDSITPEEIDAWMGSGKLSARTRKGRLQYVRLLFAFALRRGYCSRNPATAVDMPTQSAEAPGIHTPAQVRAVLDAARDVSPSLVRLLAIRYFAGLRAAEVARLEESEIGPRWITVPAHKAKTRQRRLVEIQPNLRAWLNLGGELPGQTCEQKIWELTRRIGMNWPRNCTRHSWASYHLAQFGSPSKTAMEAGHSEAMLFQNYRALVTPDAAALFWDIFP